MRATSFFCFLLVVSCNAPHIFHHRQGVEKEFRLGTQDVHLSNIPDGYKSNDIHYISGHKDEVEIMYYDSSILYLSEDIYNFPNRNNIEMMRTIESVWRCQFEMLNALKKIELVDSLEGNDKLRNCNCSFSELLAYHPPKITDLRGVNGKYIWRDILVDNYCIGYIVLDSSRVKDFDNCLETTVYER